MQSMAKMSVLQVGATGSTDIGDAHFPMSSEAIASYGLLVLYHLRFTKAILLLGEFDPLRRSDGRSRASRASLGWACRLHRFS